MNIIFDSIEGNEFGILINKNSLDIDTFAYGVARIIGARNNVIMEYEENILKKKGNWDTANKGIQMAFD